MDRIPVIIISGPTASGKSSVALKVAEAIDGEIISADSLQVYKYFDIVSDKADSDARNRVCHHMLDIVSPDQDFNAGMFKKKAYQAVCEIRERGRVPVICGGTGLYIKSLTNNLSFCGAPEERIIEEIRNGFLNKESSLLYEELKGVDPVSAAKIEVEDHYRIKRALEVFYSTGTRMSEFHKTDTREPLFKYRYFVLTMNREALYKKIDRRAEEMVQKGAVAEIRSIMDMGYQENLKPFRAIGPSQITSYLKGEMTLPVAIQALQRDSRRFAKRQLTWFRGVEEAEWISMDEDDASSAASARITEKAKNLL